MNQKADEPFPIDPISILRSMRGAGADAWAKVFSQLLNSEEYARATSAMLDTYLATSQPFRQQIEKLLIEFIQSDRFTATTRVFLDAYLETSVPFRDTLLRFMRSEAFVQAAGELLDQYLASSAPFREVIAKAVVQALAREIPSPMAGVGKLMERLDPVGLVRTMRDVGTDAVADLATAASFREAMATTMIQVLTQLNLPTRADVTSLAERLERIEEQLGTPKRHRPDRKEKQ